MNAIHHAARLLAVLGAVAIVPAQEQATTLAALAARADVVVVASAAAFADPSPELHAVEFRREQALKGTGNEHFVVLEPAGRCCGRALFALQPGDRCVLFLQRTGQTLHPVGGDRGVVAADAALIAHVHDLLAAGDAAATARVLIAALAVGDGRVRADAALTLPTLPVLPNDATARAAVLAALDTELNRGSTRVPALVDAGVRMLGDAIAPSLLTAYLQTADEGQALLLGRGLLLLSAPARAAAMATASMTDARQQVRACELLAAAPDAGAVPMLDRLLQPTAPPRVQLAASEALLAAGVSVRALDGRAPKVVLDLAQRRHTALPRLRTVQPGAPR